ncbi:MAG: hypothetical protein E7311_01950 [Clostridiales bacterium]|nr:hypothetical protein [Clostridiales bacterium]
MKPQMFKLVKYEEFIPIIKEFDTILNKEAFLDFYSKYIYMFNNSKTIILNEDCITGYEKGSIFYDEKDYTKELEFEILRPITSRQITCFDNALKTLFSDSPYYDNREEQKEHDSLAELVDCFFDYSRCEKKQYISYSEYLLFNKLMDIFINIYKK